jgi:hypothetical protein
MHSLMPVRLAGKNLDQRIRFGVLLGWHFVLSTR